MFSKSSAGPFVVKERRAMVPISRSQFTSACTRFNSPAASNRSSHVLRSANPIGTLPVGDLKLSGFVVFVQLAVCPRWPRSLSLDFPNPVPFPMGGDSLQVLFGRHGGGR